MYLLATKTNSFENWKGFNIIKRGSKLQNTKDIAMGVCASLELKRKREEEFLPERYEFTRARVLSVYDGDTLTIGAKHRGKFVQFKARVNGIDCAEIRARRGESQEDRDLRIYLSQRAKTRVEELCQGKVLKVQVLNGTVEDGTVEDGTVEDGTAEKSGRIIREKFGRLLVNFTVNGESLGVLLIREKLAIPYEGKKKDNVLAILREHWPVESRV